MSKTSTRSKMKYNRMAYKRYEFNVGMDSRLNYMIESFMKDRNSLSNLVKSLLCEHFGIDDMDEIYVPYHFMPGKDGEYVLVENKSGK